ncbi:MAG: hypothetical protein LAT82_00035 [Nanoarchaeota archaeon]|nr:hypothetical protein [Nanoarchaeota archaeon]
MSRHNKFRLVLSSILMLLLFSMSAVYANTTEQIRIELSEVVNQTILYNPLENSSGGYDVTTIMTGFINITNMNEEGATISDIFATFDNASNISDITLLSGRAGNVINTSSDEFTIRVYELEAGQSSVWTYQINQTNVLSPLRLNTTYSEFKVLAGGNISVSDVIENRYSPPAYNPDSCIYDIELDQTTFGIPSMGSQFEFDTTSVTGTDSGNTTTGATSLVWNVRGGGCLNESESTDISYVILTPEQINETQTYNMSETVISYLMNNSVSHVRFSELVAMTSYGVALEINKQIVGITNPNTSDDLVIWNGTGRLISSSNITLQLNEFTRWVATQTVGDPNTVDTDAVNTGTQLTVNDTFAPGTVLINSTSTWQSPTWLFNYTDLPTPILYGKADFQIHDDGTQIVNRTITRNGNDIFIKELYLVLGYWLEVEKNVTSLGNDSYNVHIEVYNKGNQVTPVNATISLFDFVPGNFNITSNMSDTTNSTIYPITTSWYTVVQTNQSISGDYNGTLLRWAISGDTNSTTGVVDPSFAVGPTKNENNTFIANFTVVGEGEYSLLDVFIVGVDPQQVDGATAATTLFVTEFVDKIRTSEGIFAALAGAMLVLGLLV